MTFWEAYVFNLIIPGSVPGLIEFRMLAFLLGLQFLSTVKPVCCGIDGLSEKANLVATLYDGGLAGI